MELEARESAHFKNEMHFARVDRAGCIAGKIFASVSRFVLHISAGCVQMELNDLS
jgi:hypothetical protein